MRIHQAKSWGIHCPQDPRRRHRRAQVLREIRCRVLAHWHLPGVFGDLVGPQKYSATHRILSNNPKQEETDACREQAFVMETPVDFQ